MSTFKQIAELLTDRQEIRITIQKVGEDLVTITNLDFKKKGDPIHISGTPDELDEHYIAEISKPLQHKTAFSSNADKVAEDVEKSAKKPAASSSTSSSKKKTVRSGSKKPVATKKAPVKKAAPKKVVKAPVKKAAVKKAAPKKPDIKKGLSTLLENAKKDITTKGPAANQLNIEDEAKKVDQHFDTVMLAANLAFKEGRYADAIKDYTEAQTIKPGNVTAADSLEMSLKKQTFTEHMAAGKEAIAAQKFQDAVDIYTKAFDLFPMDKDADTQLGVARKKLAAFQLLNEDLV